MQSPRRMARMSVATGAIVLAGLGLGCSNDLAGPDPGAQERALARQIEGSDAEACLAEYRRVIPLLPGMTPQERIAEMRRILALCRAPSAPQTGTLQVTAATSGDDLDPDGYTVAVSGQTSQNVGANGSVSFPNLAPADYQVELSGVADNCTVGGDNPRTVTVSANTTTTTTFSVTCEGEPSGPSGVIAFVSNATGSREIWIMNADGSNPTQLTDNTAVEQHARLSPNGSRIAFTSRDGSDRELWVMDVDGSSPTQLTSNMVDEDPKWSPDGTQIVFERVVNGVLQVMVMDADGSNPTQLTFGLTDSGDPSFSPDGNHIVFTTDTGSGVELAVMDADGANPQAITSDGGVKEDPAWANTPGGQKIAYQEDDEIHLVNPDGSGATQITNSGSGASTDPFWSPDDTMLVIQRGSVPTLDIFTMNGDGSNLLNLTSSAAEDVDPSWGPGTVAP